jgi:glycosyltransferase involved in cell wall biosynthesis
MAMKTILYMINVDWFFVSHFLPVGKEAIKKGYEVHIACAMTDKKNELEKLGFKVHKLDISRSGLNLFNECKTMYQMYKILKFVNPDIVEFLTIKPVVYGGIVSHLLKIPKKVFYITGLGYVFIAKGFKGFIVRNLVKTMYRLAITGKNNSIITENIFDKNLIESLDAVQEKQVSIIRGAGVDLGKYKFTQESSENITVVMACRLLKDKGVKEFVEAVKRIKIKGINARFDLYGDIDQDNPATITAEELVQIKADGFVNVHGFTSDIANVFSQANIVVLPSYREGLPKVLIEAAACGRAVVTTDVPGCRDAIEPNVTGLLCNVKDIDSLAEKIEQLILDQTLRTKMGKAGRDLAEKEFDITNVVKKHFQVYEN